MRLPSFSLTVQLLISSCCFASASKIVVAYPSAIPSGRLLFKSIATTLANAGHNITVLTVDQQHVKGLHRVSSMFLDVGNLWSQYNVNELEENDVEFFIDAISETARAMWQTKHVEELYENRKLLDAIIIPITNHDYILPLLENTTAALITVSLNGIDHVNMGEKSGHWMSLAINPVLESKLPRRMNFFQRFENAYRFIRNIYFKDMHLAPMIKQIVENNLPDIEDIYKLRDKHHALTLLNCHHSFCGQMPLLPSQVEIGGFHIPKSQVIANDMLSIILDKSTDGIIYFSIGAYNLIEEIPHHKMEIFMEVFQHFAQTIIWNHHTKFDYRSSLSNVYITEGRNVDQLAILSHPNTLLFVSQCGMNSILEAIYYGVPVLSIPRNPDNYHNVHRLLERNLTIQLDWNTLKEEDLVIAMKDMLEEKYRIRMRNAARLFKDREENPNNKLIRAVEGAIHRQNLAKTASRGMADSFMIYAAVFYACYAFFFFYVTYKLFECVQSSVIDLHRGLHD